MGNTVLKIDRGKFFLYNSEIMIVTFFSESFFRKFYHILLKLMKICCLAPWNSELKKKSFKTWICMEFYKSWRAWKSFHSVLFGRISWTDDSWQIQNFIRFSWEMSQHCRLHFDSLVEEIRRDCYHFCGLSISPYGCPMQGQCGHKYLSTDYFGTRQIIFGNNMNVASSLPIRGWRAWRLLQSL